MSKRKKRKKRKVRLFIPIRRYRVRSKTNSNIFCGTRYYTVNGGRTWIKSADVTYDVAMYNRLYKSGEGTWDELHPGPPYRTGGPFKRFTFTDAIEKRHTSTYYGWISPTIGYKYEGGFIPILRMHDIDPVYSPTNLAGAVNSYDGLLHASGDVSSYGPQGWNKFRPGNPTADAGVFLGELREVPRMLKGTAEYFHKLWRSMGGSMSAFAPKTVADAWLNTQFGWRPFLSDLRKFYETQQNLDKLLKQIVRDNGRWIRRKGTVKRTVEAATVSQSATTSGIWPVLESVYYSTSGSAGSRTVSKVTSQNVWFEGAFRYWIPDTSSVIWKARATAELFGLMPSPSLIWNLTPWSWLVDWCSNVGTNISNMSTGYADNLAAKYAYIMGTTQVDLRVISTASFKQGYLYDTFTYPITWKRRDAASPFGFGLDSDNFSLRQLSILTALGITRLK